MSDLQGKFAWYDLTTTDVKAATKFYGDVIGWTTEPFGEGYTIWKAGETGIGGVMTSRDAEKRPVATPHWMAYVFADDVDALTKKAAALGAKVHMAPEDIPTVGRFSVIADPQGAVIALFTPLPRESAPPRDEPADGHVSWHELLTDDPEAAFRFYAALFGWQKTEAVESPLGTYQMYGQGGRTYGGIGKRPKDYPAPSHWLYYVKVRDLDGALARVKRDGGRVMHGPMEVPGGDRVAQCVDPQGAAFALHGK